MKLRSILLSSSLLVLTALSLVLLTAAGSTAVAAPGDPETIQLTAQDNGKSLEMSVGGLLQITLPGNATTGYSWAVIANNSAVLSQVGEWEYKSEAQTATPNIVGAPGEFILTFKAVGVGTTSLQLGYKRWSNTEQQPEGTFTVNVTVAAAEAAAVEVDDMDYGKTVELALGSSLQVSLSGIAATGSSWRLVSNDPNLLVQQGEWQFQESVFSTEDVAGGPPEPGGQYGWFPEPTPDRRGPVGTFTVSFKAVGLGTDTLKFEYKKWTDSAAQLEDKFQITVNVIAPASPAPAESAPAESSTAEAAAVEVDDMDYGKTVELALGSSLQVSLSGIAATGSSWRLVSNDPNLLVQQGEWQFQESVFSTEDVAGGPPEPGGQYGWFPNRRPTHAGPVGTFTVSFKAVGLGTDTLKFEYKKWTDSAAQLEDKFQITVNVIAPLTSAGK